jgi:hypothetical protein
VKQPGWTVEETGGGAGPLVVRPLNPEAPGLALAGMGRSLAETGAFLTAEARDAEAKTRALQQTTEVSRYTLAALQQYGALKDELERVTDPDARLPRLQELEGQLRADLESLGDPQVRTRAETWLNEEYALWDKDVRTGTQALRLKQANDHFAALAEDAVARRDDSRIAAYLQDLTEQGFTAPQQAADTLAAYRTRIDRELDKDALTGMITALPYPQAVERLNGMARPGTLNEQEWAQFKDGLHAQLDVARAQAAQEQRYRQQVVAANVTKSWAAALAGTLDVAAVPGQVERGDLPPDEAVRLTTFARRGPAAENDPATYAELNAKLGDLALGRTDAANVLKFATAHASKLKPGTVDAAIEAATNRATPQVRAVEDAVQSATREIVTVTDDVYAQILALSAGNTTALTSANDQRAGQWRQVDYVRQQLRAYVQQHPAATPDEIYVESRKLLRHLRTQTAEARTAEVEAWEEDLVWGTSPAPLESYDLETRQRRTLVGGMKAVGAPAGLEGLWETLTAEEQRDVLELLRRGWTPAQILREAQR